MYMQRCGITCWLEHSEARKKYVSHQYRVSYRLISEIDGNK